MADLDLNDALSDSILQSDPENMVQRDFVATLEAETYDDKVGETVSKTDYVPLLDKDGERQDGEPVLENGQQETQGPKMPGFAVTQGGQGAAQHPEPQEKVLHHSTEQPVPSAEFLSGPFSAAGYPEHWGTHLRAAHMDTGLTGLSQPGPAAAVDAGVAPLPIQRPPAVADESLKEPSLTGEPQVACALKGDSFTGDPSAATDPSSGVWCDPWGVEAGLQVNLPFTPSVSTVISRHTSQIAGGSREPPDGHWQCAPAAGVCEEREFEGSDRKQQQKKKKKRRPRDNVYEFLESQGPSDFQEVRTENRTPRRDVGWEREEGGRSGVRVKKGKGRKKIPEDWGLPPETQLQELTANLAIYPQGMEDVTPSFQKPLVCPAEASSFPLELDEDLTSAMPPSLVEDLLSLTTAVPSIPSSPPATTLELASHSQVNEDVTSLGSFLPTEHDSEVAPLKACDKMELCIPLNPSDTCGPKQEAPHTPASNLAFHNGGERAVSMQTDPITDSLKSETPATELDDSWPNLLAAEAAPVVSSSSELNEGTTSTSSQEATSMTSEQTLPSEDAHGFEKPISLSGDAASGSLLLEEDTLPALPPVSAAEDASLYSSEQQKGPESPLEQQSENTCPAKGTSSPQSEQLPTQTPLDASPTQPPTEALMGLSSTLNPSAPPFFPSSPVATLDGGKEATGFVVCTEQEVNAEKTDKQEKTKNTDIYQKTDELATPEKKPDGGEKLEKNDKPGNTGEQKKESTDKAENMDILGKTDKNRQQMENTEKLEKVDKVVKVDKLETEKVEKVDKVDKTDIKLEKTDKIDKVENIDKLDQIAKAGTAEKTDKVEKMDKEEKADKMEKTDGKTEKVDKVESTDSKVEKTDNKVEKVNSKAEKSDKAKADSKAEKTDMFDKINEVEKTDDKVEKVDKVEKTDSKAEKVDKVEKMDSKAEKVDKVEKMDSKAEKVDKVEKTDSKAEKMDKVEKMNKAEKTEKLERIEKSEQKTDKTGKLDETEKVDIVGKKDMVEKADMAQKADKNDKTAKVDKKEKPSTAEISGKKDASGKIQDKAGKAAGKSAAANAVSVAPKKDATSPEKKTKPSAGSAKPSPTKPRANGLSAGTTAPKRPSPTLSSSSAAASKKSPMPKVTSPTAGTRRPPSTASRPPSTSTAASHEAKSKNEVHTAEKRPPAASQAQSAAPKNSSTTAAPTKPAGAPRVPPSTRPSPSTLAPRRSSSAKTESESGEVKKASMAKATSEASQTKSSTNRTSATPGTPGSTSTTRARTSKPATSSSTVPERKPPVPRAPRSSAAATKASPRPRSSPSPKPSPSPDIKNARSKISTTQGRPDPLAKGETSQGKVQIVNKKLDFSHVTSRLGSKDNIKHVPGGGNVQILNKKVDLSKVTSKCGSKTNIKHKPGGGDAKPDSRKGNTKEKAPSKAETVDSVSKEADSSHIKADTAQATKGDAALSGGDPAAVPVECAAQANGVNESAPCGSGGLRDDQRLDSRIPETSI
ncbi:microtubule-associated protein 4 isoform X4 [Scleropages formosus]|uniref:microtubule-associated protein 4 isoform X4 n=1 Tax=Scleropages formosus TaxID=113540 RepID=UPI0010FAA6F3|nr:microtubule-associated protein 4-like isoform X4 [Scleropages formosus]